MTEAVHSINHKGYTIDIFPDNDVENPLMEDSGMPTLVLHRQAERHFGWTTDQEWGERLNDALDEIAGRGVVTHLYGPGGALDIVSRWMRVCYGISTVMPVSAMQHSGTTVYLGSGRHWEDTGGWDSGWIGWLFVTPEQLAQWGTTPVARVEEAIRGAFKAFAAWVEGDCYGYTITAPDGEEIDSCWGYYGSECFEEPDGWVLQECREVIDHHIGPVLFEMAG